MKDVRQSAMSIEVTDPKQAARNLLELGKCGGDWGGICRNTAFLFFSWPASLRFSNRDRCHRTDKVERAFFLFRSKKEGLQVRKGGVLAMLLTA
jgi:hypothetical protein